MRFLGERAGELDRAAWGRVRATSQRGRSHPFVLPAARCTDRYLMSAYVTDNADPTTQRKGEPEGERAIPSGKGSSPAPSGSPEYGKNMPLIQREKRPELVPVRIKLESNLLNKLQAYANFMESSVDHVIAASLEVIISKDREFRENLTANATAATPPELATRKPRKPKNSTAAAD